MWPASSATPTPTRTAAGALMASSPVSSTGSLRSHQTAGPATLRPSSRHNQARPLIWGRWCWSNAIVDKCKQRDDVLGPRDLPPRVIALAMLVLPPPQPWLDHLQRWWSVIERTVWPHVSYSLRHRSTNTCASRSLPIICSGVCLVGHYSAPLLDRGTQDTNITVRLVLRGKVIISSIIHRALCRSTRPGP